MITYAFTGLQGLKDGDRQVAYTKSGNIRHYDCFCKQYPPVRVFYFGAQNEFPKESMIWKWTGNESGRRV